MGQAVVPALSAEPRKWSLVGGPEWEAAWGLGFLTPASQRKAEAANSSTAPLPDPGCGSQSYLPQWPFVSRTPNLHHHPPVAAGI